MRAACSQLPAVLPMPDHPSPPVVQSLEGLPQVLFRRRHKNLLRPLLLHRNSHRMPLYFSFSKELRRPRHGLPFTSANAESCIPKPHDYCLILHAGTSGSVLLELLLNRSKLPLPPNPSSLASTPPEAVTLKCVVVQSGTTLIGPEPV